MIVCKLVGYGEVISREMPVSGGELAPGAAKRGLNSPHLTSPPSPPSPSPPPLPVQDLLLGAAVCPRNRRKANWFIQSTHNHLTSPRNTSHHLTSPHLTSHPPHLHLTAHTTYNDTQSPHLASHHLTTPHLTSHPHHLHLTSHCTCNDSIRIYYNIRYTILY